MNIFNEHSSNIAAGIALASLLLGGCSVLQPAKPVNMASYALGVQFEPAVASAGGLTVLVSAPIAQPGFNSQHMIYIKRPHELEYFSQNQWVDSPARMLAPLLIQALEHSGKYRAVIQARTAAMADLRLDTEIIRMQHEFLTSPSQAHLTVRAQLIDIQAKKVLATREFDVMEAAPSDDPYGGVIATNRAVKKILQQIADFGAQESKAGEPRNAPK